MQGDFGPKLQVFKLGVIVFYSKKGVKIKNNIFCIYILFLDRSCILTTDKKYYLRNRHDRFFRDIIYDAAIVIFS